jgi:hypothetical protein
VRAQIYWRRLEPVEFSKTLETQTLVALDSIVSVNTSVLDVDPQAHVRSSIVALSALRLSDGRFDELALGPADATIAARDGAGCFVFRLPDGARSYVEMVHPVDFGQSIIRCTPHATPTDAGTPAGEGGPRHCETLHRLFHQRLEKGVILRARIRAALVRRDRDTAVALSAYERFAAAEPPLTA